MIRRAALPLILLTGLAACRAPQGEYPSPSPGATGWISDGFSTPVPIQEHAVAAFDDGICVIGGIVLPLAITDAARCMAPDTGVWTDLPPLPFDLHHANAAVADGRLFVLGALTGFGFNQAGLVVSIAPGESDWTTHGDMEPTRSRGASGVAVLGTDIVLIGGFREGVAVSFADRYDSLNDVWTPLPDLPEPREHLVGAALNGRIWALAGRQGSIGSHMPTVLSWADGETEWSSAADMNVSRGGFAGAALDGRIFVFGGEGADNPSGVFSEAEAYDPAEDRWDPVDPMPSPRHGLGAAALGDRIWLPGGANIEALGAVDTVDSFRP